MPRELLFVHDIPQRIVSSLLGCRRFYDPVVWSLHFDRSLVGEFHTGTALASEYAYEQTSTYTRCRLASFSDAWTAVQDRRHSLQR